MAWTESITSALSNHFNTQVSLKNTSSVGGGSINDTYRFETSAGDYFIKKNSSQRYPEMFAKEARGLGVLKAAHVIAVPEVILHFEEGDEAYLVLKYIRSAGRNPDFWESFAKSLTHLHRQTNTHFGLDHDNYIGSLVQSNKINENWSDFFRSERLEPQIKMARDAHKIGRDVVQAFERFSHKLDEIFPNEPLALLHGDLWGGNFMVGDDGVAVIIDPAVYFGHREMDLDMSQLFGGFDARFYEAYENFYPLEKGWHQRLDFCNLYPLLVHVNLFGGGYVGSVRSIVSKF